MITFPDVGSPNSDIATSQNLVYGFSNVTSDVYIKMNSNDGYNVSAQHFREAEGSDTDEDGEPVYDVIL